MKKTVSGKNNLLVLADDLTGALDTGVQFAKKSIITQVYLSSDKVKAGHDDITVMVINTNTRHVSPMEAGSNVRAATEASKNYSFFYKKTDSCLRGNIGAELEALMQATESQTLPFAPAYPRLKRTTIDGRQYIEGIPIDKSSMANDSLNPVTESYIPSIIRKQSSVHVHVVPFHEIHDFHSDIHDFQGNHLKKPQIIVFDAEKNVHLKTTAKKLYKSGLLKISAGCAGFAEALIEVLPLDRTSNKTTFSGKLASQKKLPVLIISGSLHPVSINQIKAAEKTGFPLFALNVQNLDYSKTKNTDALIDNASRALQKNRAAILGTEATLGVAQPVLTDESAKKLPDIIGKTVQKIIKKTGSIHLVIFGGDTLLGIMKALNYNCLEPLNEIRPGIVLARPESGPGLIVTKAGAFGKRNLIKTIMERFENDTRI